MPIVTDTNATILVTGSNGFIGTWVVDVLLRQGFNVRATVRSEAKGQHLLDTFKSFGAKLQLFPITDIAEEGAFDEAVKGVEGIIHTAAIVTLELNHLEPSEVIDPAVKGNIGILNSAKKHGDLIKRVVLTSSCGARTAHTTVPKTVNDDSWNDQAVGTCEAQGKAAPGLSKYQASKVLAERAAWDWFENNKSSIHWDLTVISPPWIFGPPLHEVKSAETLNAPNMFFYTVIVKNQLSGQSPLKLPSHGYIDCRDVAELLVRALLVPEAGGQRILTVAGQFVWQDAIDAVNSLPTSPWPSHTAPFVQGEKGEKVHNIKWDTSKEGRIFGFKYRTLADTARDILADYEKRGWS